MVFGLAILAGRLAVSAFGTLATGFATRAPAIVLLGPELMLSVLAAFVVAALELLWLGTVVALACGEDGIRRKA
jgi:VIT1/CCC1 family predicted Fe2+/Mn2+ transporter